MEKKIKIKLLYIVIILSHILCIQCSINKLKKLNSDKQEPVKLILADRETLLMRGYSTGFTDGYMDGCQSGQYSAGDHSSNYVKNQELADLNKDYSLGWKQGNSFCYQHMRSLIKHSNNQNSFEYKSKEMIELEKQRMWSELKK